LKVFKVLLSATELTCPSDNANIENHGN
jgi:hypothetical protein